MVATIINESKFNTSFERLGLSNYKARAYQTFLSQPTVTGYKWRRFFCVRSSRRYETVNQFSANGLLMVCQTVNKILLILINFKTSLNKNKEENRGNIAYLRETHPALSTRQDTSIRDISEWEYMIKVVCEIISDSEK